MVDSQRGAYRRVGYNPTSASAIFVLLKTLPKAKIKIKTPQQITRTLTIFVDDGIMAHNP